MHPEIERFIDMALADGVLTDKEREIILRKAEKLGEDVDEVEMILEGKLELLNKEQTIKTVATPPISITQQSQEEKPQVKSNKEGEVRKCPACGAIIESFTIKCEDCGHEFRGREANATIKQLFKLLQNAENIEVKEEKGSAIDKLVSGGIKGVLFGNKDYDARKESLNLEKHYLIIENKKKQIISDFPIPTTKEDLLEFLSIAVPKAIPFKDNFWNGLSEEQEAHNDWSSIWKTKCEQIIIKARFLFKNDKNLIEHIENYSKQLNTKK